MKKILFLVIPLILTIGIIPAISFSEQIDSPRKQMAKGIAPDQVICKEGRELIIRSNGAPACVKPDTAVVLEQRGLAVIPPPSKKIAVEPKVEPSTPVSVPSQDCSGTARCFTGIVTSVIDGDTIKVANHSIRFALSSAPELNEFQGITSRNLIDTICPVGSMALVDEDDGQTQGSYGRILAVVYCNGVNLNEELLDSGLGYLTSGFCDQSEFAGDYWAKKHGCTVDDVMTPQPSPSITPQQTEQKQPLCDPSYPDVCIAPSPPDLDCGDIPYTNFKVLRPDPHRFDGDNDGIGCETTKSSVKSTSSTSSKSETDCDPSYPDFCIPPPPPDLDCKDIPQKRFTVLQPDPHRFDGDKDGIGCES